MFWHIERLAGSGRGIFDGATQRFNTYEAFCESVAAVEKMLSSGGKRLVMLLCNNSLPGLAAYIAGLRAGHAVMLLNLAGDAALRGQVINLYAPEVIVTCSDIADLPEGYYAVPSPVAGLCVAFARTPADDYINPDTGVLLSTSGTTGSPKFVRLSYRSIQANAEAIAQYLAIDADESAVTSLPMSYSYGLSVVNSHLLAGANLACTNASVMDREFWEYFRLCRCSSFAGVPFSYHMLERLRFGRLELPSLRTLTQAGGRLAPEKARGVAEVAHRRQYRFYIMYGQTEASARISYLPWERLAEKPGSVGIAIPGGKIRIMKDGSEVAVPELCGEIVFEGANVMQGYAETRRCLSKGDELGGRLLTGDIGYKDADGYLFLTGRLKRFLKLYGLRVNLDEVEQMLEGALSCPVACTGCDETLRILIESQSDNDVAEATKRITSIYHLHATSISVLRTSALPVTPSRKKDYTTIEREFKRHEHS